MENLKNKKIFISGGAGVIGIQLVKLLEKNNAKIFVGDLKPKPISFSKKIIYYHGDLNIINPIKIKEFQPDIFIHLAASFERTKESKSFFGDNFSNNILLSNYLLSIFANLKCTKKIIFASSYLVYNSSYYEKNSSNNEVCSINEKFPINSRNLIGASKLYHESELFFYNKFLKKKIYSVRIFRGFGKGSRDIISRWIDLASKNKKILLYNEENSFDYIYAADTANALLHFVKKNPPSDIYNLGSGKSVPVKDIVKNLKIYFPKLKVLKKGKKIKFENTVSDNNKIQNILKWKGNYDIKRAIKELIVYNKFKSKKTLKHPNFLITSSSNKISLIKCFIDAVKRYNNLSKVYICDNNINCLSRHYFNKIFFKTEKIKNLDFKKLVNILKKKNIKYIYPTGSYELLYWKEIEKKLKHQGIKLIIANKTGIMNSIDKLKFFKILSKNNLPCIDTYENLNKIKSKKIVIKERYGLDNKKIYLGISRQESSRLFNNFNSPIFQSYVKGQEFTADIWSSKYKKVFMNLRKRTLVLNGESKITVNFRNKKIESLLKKIVKTININGIINIQGFIKKNKIYIIECNPRFGGASTQSIESGLDLFYYSIIEATGKKIEDIPKIKIVKQIRYEKDIFY